MMMQRVAMPYDDRFCPHPNPLPEGEGACSLLPLGEGLGMRGSGI
jgi:hypothetical protein